MNCIREAEELLYNYRDMGYSVKRMEREIERLANGPKDIKAVQYDKPSGRKYYDQDETLNCLYRLKKLSDMKKQTEERIQEIDQVLDDMDKDPDCDFFKEVLVMWYVEKLSKDMIADEIGYSSRKSVYLLRNRAINKFSTMVFGIQAI